MKLTASQWEALRANLSGAYGSADLLIDGYEISLRVQRLRPLKYTITVFVNGTWSGAMLRSDCEERRRFFRPVCTSLFAGSRLQKLRKAVGKRSAQSMVKRTTGTYWLPHWPSFGALKRHLLHNNESIAIKEPTVD